MIEPKTAAEHEVLNLTEDDLQRIASAAEGAHHLHFAGARIEHTAGKTHGVKVILPAKRTGGEHHAVTFHGKANRQDAEAGAKLLSIASRYLLLLPAAVDLIRRLEKQLASLRSAASPVSDEPNDVEPSDD